MILYDYWRSSAAYRVRIALAMTGEAYERVDVNLLDGAQTSPANLARNPQGLIPTLEVDGLRLTQSLAICEYLSATRGLGLIPDDPADAARVRALAYAVAMDIHPITNLRVARRAAALRDGMTIEDWMRPVIADGLAALETMLGAGPYCHGNRVSLADLCLVPQVYNARRWAVDLSEMPVICAICKRLEALPAFVLAHPDTVRPA